MRSDANRSMDVEDKKKKHAKHNKAHRKERSQYGRLLRYNLTPEEYETRVAEQSGMCACCGEPLTAPHVDHDHACCDSKRTCGKCTRGILCGRCNRGLGAFADDISILEKTIAYLKKWKEK